MDVAVPYGAWPTKPTRMARVSASRKIRRPDDGCTEDAVNPHVVCRSSTDKDREMKFAKKTLVFSVLCATLVNAGASLVSAQPGAELGKMRAPEIQPAGIVEFVQYRGRSYDRGRHRGNDGRNIGLGIAGLVIGGIILSEAARAEHRGSHGGDWQRCAQTYRSFERDTGMYTGYDGIRRPCPYLN
jgi:hypothetical protein